WDVSGDGGVCKEELYPGSGQVVPPNASVEDITLGGLEIGLLTMKKGEVARFVFTPPYAYGQQGCPPLIPPNATVMFEVEVLDFLDSAESDSFFELTAEQQETFPLQKVLKVAETEREFGNYLYRKQHFESAIDRYKRAFSVLGRSPSSETEQRQINASKLLLLLNLSLTYLKLKRPAQALAYGEKALEIDQRNAKALFRCGQACLCMTEYEKARDFLVRAQHIQPFNHDINNELKKLASCYKDYVEKEKEMCCRMFASLNTSSG
ncbi:PREDICTED: inactive peptidyl-prolyl cis-trans isomerase FKBP6, partial [Mesitornis unicolor]|uniref:inactive peptidyl-prolyl cis-trans isomerase FKBP6 n=1 Tax=Mesitornis unicolor TaxID=54374 RepID=UPI0005293D8F